MGLCSWNQESSTRTGSGPRSGDTITPTASLKDIQYSLPACLHQRLDTLEEANFLLVLQIIQHFLQWRQEGKAIWESHRHLLPTLALFPGPFSGYLLHISISPI